MHYSNNIIIIVYLNSLVVSYKLNQRVTVVIGIIINTTIYIL